MTPREFVEALDTVGMILMAAAPILLILAHRRGWS